METQINKLDFTGQNIYVGFDAHLKSWKVSILTELISHKTFSQPPSPDTLVQYLEKNFPNGNYHTAYEAGFCGYWIHNRLKHLGVNSIVVNPADIPITQKEKLQKEDKRDSLKIAKALRSGQLTPIYVPSLKTLEDRTLMRTRAMVVKDLIRYKNRIKSFLHFHGIEIPVKFSESSSHWSKAFILWLESVDTNGENNKSSLTVLINELEHLRLTILNLNRQIRSLSQTEYYNKNVCLLRSLPGFGLITSMLLLTELESINRFRNIDHLCSFVGYIPSTHSSGEKEIAGNITPRGHGVLRTAIIESAWVAVRIDPALNRCYHQYSNRMDTKKAIVKIAKKLLNRVRFVLKNEEPYKFSIM